MSRKHEQGDLLFKLGQLFGPLLKVGENPSGFDADEKVRILARFFADQPGFTRIANEFFHGEPGHRYEAQSNLCEGSLLAVVRHQIHARGDEAGLYATAASSAGEIRDLILSVPVPIDSTIYEARTPFSTYCLVKDLCSTAKTAIVWSDRYFSQDLFHRYFAEVPLSVAITVVTWPDSKWKGADLNRHSEFMNISRLFAQQRGTTGYRLVTNANFHDRWLRCDDKMFTLGGSIKDLGNSHTFTITRLDGTSENRKHFDDAVSEGTEVFGPTAETHP